MAHAGGCRRGEAGAPVVEVVEIGAGEELDGRGGGECAVEILLAEEAAIRRVGEVARIGELAGIELHQAPAARRGMPRDACGGVRWHGGRDGVVHGHVRAQHALRDDRERHAVDTPETATAAGRQAASTRFEAREGRRGRGWGCHVRETTESVVLRQAQDERAWVSGRARVASFSTLRIQHPRAALSRSALRAAWPAGGGVGEFGLGGGAVGAGGEFHARAAQAVHLAAARTWRSSRCRRRPRVVVSVKQAAVTVASASGRARTWMALARRPRLPVIGN